MYRIVQEALTNVIRHAGTGVSAEVAIEVLDDRVTVSVRDEGEGGEGGPSGGHGLVGMRERVELLGGTFSAGRRSGGGFEVQAVLPRESGAH